MQVLRPFPSEADTRLSIAHSLMKLHCRNSVPYLFPPGNHHDSLHKMIDAVWRRSCGLFFGKYLQSAKVSVWILMDVCHGASLRITGRFQGIERCSCPTSVLTLSHVSCLGWKEQKKPTGRLGATPSIGGVANFRKRERQVSAWLSLTLPHPTVIVVSPYFVRNRPRAGIAAFSDVVL